MSNNSIYSVVMYHCGAMPIAMMHADGARVDCDQKRCIIMHRFKVDEIQ